MILARNMGLQRVIVETDSHEIQSLWSAPQKSVGVHILGEMKEISDLLQGFELRYSGRQINLAAYRLAKEALVIDMHAVIFDVISGWLTVFFQ